MIITNIQVKNWRNFREANIPLRERMFLVGPNACGKSNFLDIFRFLRDVAKRGGGLQTAVRERGGLSKIRCLSARSTPDVEIEIALSNEANGPIEWTYSIGIKQERIGSRTIVCLSHERVLKRTEILLDRPDEQDRSDPQRLTQTHLEQINANQKFREVAEFLNDVLYLHLVPQLVRNPDAFSGPGIPGDPFGRSFLERVARTQQRTRKTRLKKIEQALRRAVPQLKDLTDIKDEAGVPHLEAVYEHWRPQGARQREDQFSDGTLRLIGLLWTLMEKESVLLLEEPELSLHAGLVRMIPSMMSRVLQKNQQVILSTHSADLLSDKGIGGEEVLVLTPGPEGTRIEVASSIREVRSLLESGLSVGEVVIPRTESQQMLFAFMDLHE
jgi:predicted ATPase